MSSLTRPEQILAKRLAPVCTCAGNGYVHEVGCAYVGFHIPCTANYISITDQLHEAAGMKPRRMGKPCRPPRKSRAVPDYKMILQFHFTRPINIELWKQIKAPPGWKKLPTSKQAQSTYRGVRFRCDDFKFTLTPEEISLLHMKLLLSLEAT